MSNDGYSFNPICCNYLKRRQLIEVILITIAFMAFVYGAVPILAIEPPTAEEVDQLVKEHPLTIETWPLWRDYYVRLYFADVGEAPTFYEFLRAFHHESLQEQHPEEWQTDPIIWVIRCHRLLAERNPAECPITVEFANKALLLGDPDGISSMCLAKSLIQNVLSQDIGKSLTEPQQVQLDQAEKLVEHVSQLSPRNSVSGERGMIALARNDRKKATEQFKQATEENPTKEWIASQYLALELAENPGSKITLTRKLLERFPESSALHAWYAYALFHSHSFAEAADELARSKQLGGGAEKMLTKVVCIEIENSASIGSDAVTGFKAMEERNYKLAIAMFRRAWSKGPRTVKLAHSLMFSQIQQVNSRLSKSSAQEMVSEFASICSEFPNEGDLEAGRGIALAFARDYREAQKSFDRSRQLGADVRSLVGTKTLRYVADEAKKEADQAAVNEVATATATGIGLFVATLLAWIAIMFGIGMILAISIPRTPAISDVSQTGMSSRELWLERFYLIILGISLILFYLSVPFVTLGIFAVSLALFALLLMLRVLHIGVLYRGFWATWHMLRMVFWGPSNDHFGLQATEEDQPRLFAELAAVAREIDTRMVDRVFLVPGSVVAVSQEGVGPFGLFGHRKRVLHLGVSILPWLTRDEFRSILAHEYAHFSRHDPFVYRFVFQVSNTLANSMAVMKAAAGALNHVNPFYAFYWLYLRGYALLSAGYSRSREFLADRRAVLAYGKEPFISGLRKICQEGDMFEYFAYSNTAQMLTEGKAFLNVFDCYREFREQPESVEHRIKSLQQILETKSTWFDSHPTLDERIAAADSFPEQTGHQDSTSALNLLSDAKAVEEQLTKILTNHIHQQLVSQS